MLRDPVEPGLAPFRVVLADDSEDMRELLATALHRTGRFEVVASGRDGAEALEAVTAHRPDLALIDLGMPGVGGLDVLAELTAAAPETQVVVVSGFPPDPLAGVAGERGAVGYVQKGLSPRRMVDEIVAVAGVLEAVEAVLAERVTSLAQDPRSSAAARRFVQETLSRWACDDLLDTVTLLVSELVANSVVHASSGADVAVRLLPSTLRLEVSDGSAYVPAPADADLDGESGRGLAMVEALASGWGVEPTEGGKTIWFEVPRPDAPATAPA